MSEAPHTHPHTHPHTRVPPISVPSIRIDLLTPTSKDHLTLPSPSSYLSPSQKPSPRHTSSPDISLFESSQNHSSSYSQAQKLTNVTPKEQITNTTQSSLPGFTLGQLCWLNPPIAAYHSERLRLIFARPQHAITVSLRCDHIRVIASFFLCLLLTLMGYLPGVAYASARWWDVRNITVIRLRLCGKGVRARRDSLEQLQIARYRKPRTESMSNVSGLTTPGMITPRTGTRAMSSKASPLSTSASPPTLSASSSSTTLSLDMLSLMPPAPPSPSSSLTIPDAATRHRSFSSMAAIHEIHVEEMNTISTTAIATTP